MMKICKIINRLPCQKEKKGEEMTLGKLELKILNFGPTFLCLLEII